MAVGEVKFANPHIVDEYDLAKMVSITINDLFEEERVILVLNLCYSSSQNITSPLPLGEIARLARFCAQSLMNLVSIADESIRESIGRITPHATGVSALFDSVLPILQSTTHARFASIFLWNDTEGCLEIERSSRPEPPRVLGNDPIKNVCVSKKIPFLLRDDTEPPSETAVQCRTMAAPIISTTGEVLGVLACYEPQVDKSIPLSFSSFDLRILIKISSLISPSIERFVRLRKGSNLDRAVKEVAASIASEFDLLEVLQRTIEVIVNLTNSELGSIYLLEDDRLVMRAAAGSNRHLINKASYNVGEGLTGAIALGKILTFKTREELVASSLYLGKYDGDIWPTTAPKHCENFLGVPIRLRGQIFGVLKIANKHPSEDHPTPYFTDEDIQLVGVISSFLGYAIESARLEEKKIKTFRLLAQSTIDIESARTVDDAISIVMSSLEESGYENALLSLYDKSDDMLEGAISSGRGWANLEGLIRYSLTSDNILTQVLRSNKPEFIADSRADNRCDKKLVYTGDIIAQYIMPLRLGDELIGTLQIDFGQHSNVPEDTRLILQAFAGHLAVAISRIRSVDALLELTNQVMSSSRFIVAETLSSMAVHSVHHQIRKITSDLKRDLGRKDIRAREFLKETLSGWERELGRLEIDLDKALSFVRADREVDDDCSDVHLQVQKSLDFWITSLARAKCTVDKRLIAKDGLCRLQPQACQEIVSVMLVNSIQAYAKRIIIETSNDIDVRLMDKVAIRHALCLDFSDNGVGLTTNHPEEIFEPTYSTKPDKFGTGLGLFIARQLARRAGGDLRVKEVSPKTKGVTLSLLLPVVSRRV